MSQKVSQRYSSSLRESGERDSLFANPSFVWRNRTYEQYASRFLYFFGGLLIWTSFIGSALMMASLKERNEYESRDSKLFSVGLIIQIMLFGAGGIIYYVSLHYYNDDQEFDLKNHMSIDEFKQKMEDLKEIKPQVYLHATRAFALVNPEAQVEEITVWNFDEIVFFEDFIDYTPSFDVKTTLNPGEFMRIAVQSKIEFTDDETQKHFDQTEIQLYKDHPDIWKWKIQSNIPTVPEVIVVSNISQKIPWHFKPLVYSVFKFIGLGFFFESYVRCRYMKRKVAFDSMKTISILKYPDEEKELIENQNKQAVLEL